MSDLKNGGHAFPTVYQHNAMTEDGMTMRNYLAAKAMQSLIAVCFDHRASVARTDGGAVTETTIASQAYAFADAMIEAGKS
jgi:hypothetical protein